MSKIEVSGAGSAQSVKIDGLDISGMVSNLSFNVRAGNLPTVSVDLLITSFEIDASEMKVIINEKESFIGELEPLYDLLKAHFEVAQALEGKGSEETYVKFDDGVFEIKGKIDR